MTIPKFVGPGIAFTPANMDLIQADYENIARSRHLIHSFASPDVSAGYDAIIHHPGEVHPPIENGFQPLLGSGFFHYDPADWLTSVNRRPRLLLRGTYVKGSTAAGVTSVYRIARMIEPIAEDTSGIPEATVVNLGTSISFSPADANATTKTAIIDTTDWPAGLYGVRMTNTGAPSGLPWTVVGQVLAYTQ